MRVFRCLRALGRTLSVHLMFLGASLSPLFNTLLSVPHACLGLLEGLAKLCLRRRVRAVRLLEVRSHPLRQRRDPSRCLSCPSREAYPHSHLPRRRLLPHQPHHRRRRRRSTTTTRASSQSSAEPVAGPLMRSHRPSAPSASSTYMVGPQRLRLQFQLALHASTAPSSSPPRATERCQLSHRHLPSRPRRQGLPCRLATAAGVRDRERLAALSARSRLKSAGCVAISRQLASSSHLAPARTSSAMLVSQPQCSRWQKVQPALPT